MMFNSSADFIDKLNKIFNGFIALPLLLVAFGYLEIFSGRYTGYMVLTSWLYGIPLILIILSVMIYFSRSFKIQIRNINSALTLADKVQLYYVIARKYYIQVFGLSLFAVVLLFLFGEKSFAGAYAFILFMLSVNRPGVNSITSQLKLDGEEKSYFLDKVPF